MPGYMPTKVFMTSRENTKLFSLGGRTGSKVVETIGMGEVLTPLAGDDVVPFVVMFTSVPSPRHWSVSLSYVTGPQHWYVAPVRATRAPWQHNSDELSYVSLRQHS